MKKTYFNHDSTARNDYRVIKMRAKLGMEAYGIFWSLLEMLFTEENKLCVDDYDSLAFGLQCDSKVKKSNYYNDIAFPDYYDIHYAKRIEQDLNKTKQYHKHLRDLGYTQQRNNYNGETKWIKK